MYKRKSVWYFEMFVQFLLFPWSHGCRNGQPLLIHNVPVLHFCGKRWWRNLQFSHSHIGNSLHSVLTMCLGTGPCPVGHIGYSGSLFPNNPFFYQVELMLSLLIFGYRCPVLMLSCGFSYEISSSFGWYMAICLFWLSFSFLQNYSIVSPVWTIMAVAFVIPACTELISPFIRLILSWQSSWSYERSSHLSLMSLSPLVISYAPYV